MPARLRAGLLAPLLFLLVGCGAGSSDIAREGVPRSPFWRTALPKDEGLDPRILAEANRRARTEFDGVASLLLARHGRLVYEQYYRGVEAGSRLPVFSITKSVVSALVGIAMADGSVKSLDERPVHYLPEGFGSGTDVRARTITVRQVLTMTAGFLRTPPIRPGDPVPELIDRPLYADPGTAFSYDGGSSDLIFRRC